MSERRPPPSRGGRAARGEVTVVDDADLAMSLEGLGLSRENYRAVLLLPLIEVAWADGRVQRAERRRIVQIATKYGIDPGQAWLDRWLRRRPSKKAFFAARTVLLALMARAGRDAVPVESVDQVLDLCLSVAEAAGGLFGLAFTVSRSERDCIEQIAASLALGPALPDTVVSAWHDAQRRWNLAEAPTTHKKRTRYGILDQTTAHLDIWSKRTQTLPELPDPEVATEGDLSNTSADGRTVARVVVPVPFPDDTGAIPALGARALSDLVSEGFAGADDVPTHETIALLAPALGEQISDFEPSGIHAPVDLGPPAGPPRVPDPSATPPGVDRAAPPPVPVGLRSITPVEPPPPPDVVDADPSDPGTPPPAQRRRVAQVAHGEPIPDDEPTLPFFDDVNVGTYTGDLSTTSTGFAVVGVPGRSRGT